MDNKSKFDLQSTLSLAKSERKKKSTSSTNRNSMCRSLYTKNISDRCSTERSMLKPSQAKIINKIVNQSLNRSAIISTLISRQTLQ